VESLGRQPLPHCGGGLVQAPPLPPPHACPSLTYPALGVYSYLKVTVPKKHYCNLPGTAEKRFAKSLDLFKNFSHLQPQHKKVFPQILTLIIPLWHCECPGTPSEFPSLTLQALLQVMHPFVKEVAFVKEAACFW
jgi:hypothetical protein